MNLERWATVLCRSVFLPGTEPFCESTHHGVLLLLRCLQRSERFLEWMGEEFRLEDGKLRVSVLGIDFPNPFILAAGMDKDARAVPALLAFGPGGMEVGSFTLVSQGGNPSTRIEERDGRKRKIKRMKRFADGTVINWLGLPGVGTYQAAKNLEACQEKVTAPVGVSLAVSPGHKNKTARRLDLGFSLNFVYPLKPAWITYNIHCPNSEDDEGSEQRLEEGLASVKIFAEEAERVSKRLGFEVPLLAKIGPDMNGGELRLMVEAIKQAGYKGVVATNATLGRTGSREKYAWIKRGGLSGRLLFERSLETVRLVREFDRELGGEPLVIMGCGGIGSVEDWWKMRDAGADLGQILTGFIFGGPYFFKELKRDYLGVANR